MLSYLNVNMGEGGRTADTWYHNPKFPNKGTKGTLKFEFPCKVKLLLYDTGGPYLGLGHAFHILRTRHGSEKYGQLQDCL